MARQVLPIVGAVVGAYFGNPQLGYAIGSIIGNAVDPQRIRGPRLQEIPSQTASEGGYRQVVYGTSWINNTNIIDFGDVQRVTVEEQQGKGRGPIIESERLYRTYAIGLGEPLQSIRVIRKDGKIVYDIRPGSTILSDSAAFASRFRFYTGAEDQLPDPDLEALPHNGVGNTPYYRGTAYLVFPNDDLTDLQGRIPTYEVEGQQVSGASSATISLVTSWDSYSGTPDDLQTGPALNWTGTISDMSVSISGTYVAGSIRDSVAASRFQWRKWNASTLSWDSLPAPSDMPVVGPRALAWDRTETYLAAAIVAPAPDNIIIWKRVGDALIKLDLTDGPPDEGRGVAWDSATQRIAFGNDDSSDGLYVFDFVNEDLINPRSEASASMGIATQIAFMEGVGSRYIAAANTGEIAVFDCTETPLRLAAILNTGTDVRYQAGEGIFWDASGSYLFGVGRRATDSVHVYDFDGSVIGMETLVYSSSPADQPASDPSGSSLTYDGDYLAVSRSTSATPIIYEVSGTLPPTLTKITDPPDALANIADLRWVDSEINTIDPTAVLLSDLVEDICDRCGLDSSDLDTSELTDEVLGVTLGGPYDGAGAITSLMPAYFFDLYEADRLVWFPKRGAAVVETITADDLIEEPDENTLRGQDIEYPRSILLKYLDAEQNYAAPAAVVQRNSPDIRVRGEATAELPISLSRTEAFQVADRMLKVMWEDLNGEATFSLPAGPFAWLTPTDCLGLSLRGALYRIRVEKVEYSAGVLKVTARRDRQSAYTSVLTPIPLPTPTPPPSALPGDTTFVVMNLPALVDGQDLLGVHIAMTGSDGFAWAGAQVSYRVEGASEWISLGSFTTRAKFGFLTSALPDASPYYTDTTNALTVQLVRETDQLETISQEAFLSEGNPAAVVNTDFTAEIIQFRDAQDDGDGHWTLTTLQRGRLHTEPSEHLSGRQFVDLNGAVFLPLPSSVIGETLEFRVTSLGTSPETAPTQTLVWEPEYSQYEFPPAHLFLERDGDDITASAVPRLRFGTEDNPIASTNWTGYRWTATDGSNTATADTVFTDSDYVFDVTGWATPVTVTVALTNRITGPGPSLSEQVA